MPFDTGEADRWRGDEGPRADDDEVPWIEVFLCLYCAFLLGAFLEAVGGG
jgi:hypothetical protein